MLTQKSIIDAAEKLGWSCKIEKQKKTKPFNCGEFYRKWYICFSRYTNFGQDVCFEFELKTLQELPGELAQRWEDYDPDEETSLWIGEDGHGKNGAPYHISDILKDMQEVDSKLEKLSDAIYKL